jgi:DNA-binding response OmpR family regulator
VHPRTSSDRVLVVEGDDASRKQTCEYLRHEGFQVQEADNGLDALSALRRGAVDIALIDATLPQLDGLELVRRVRRESLVPIILFTAPVEQAQRISGLEAGADDSVARPLVMPEVVARVRAQLRRARGFEAEDAVLRAGPVELDLRTRRCTVGGRAVRLTRREFDLLSALLRYPGRIHTREQLLELVWGDGGISPRTVDTHVASLRRKLELAVPIETLRGIGYRVDPV